LSFEYGSGQDVVRAMDRAWVQEKIISLQQIDDDLGVNISEYLPPDLQESFYSHTDDSYDEITLGQIIVFSILVVAVELDLLHHYFWVESMLDSMSALKQSI
jgi:hypothetical protein